MLDGDEGLKSTQRSDALITSINAKATEGDKLRLQILLEEYKQMRDEAKLQLVEYKKVINLVVISFGALAAVFTAKGTHVPESLWFLGGFFYSLLSLYILRHMWAVICLARYLELENARRVREILRRTDGGIFDDRTLLGWEILGPKLNYSGKLLTPLEMVTASIPLLPALGLLVQGWSVATFSWNPYPLRWPSTSGVVAVLATTATAYVIVIAIWMRFVLAKSLHGDG